MPANKVNLLAQINWKGFDCTENVIDALNVHSPLIKRITIW